MKKRLSSALLCVAVLTACGEKGERADVADVCRMDDGTLVVVEGFLVLPNFMNNLISQKNGMVVYELLLAEKTEGVAGKGTVIKTSIPATRNDEGNCIAELPPEGYTQKDLRIFTDAGKTVGSRDRLKITGQISKSANSCILKVSKIEAP